MFLSLQSFSFPVLLAFLAKYLLVFTCPVEQFQINWAQAYAKGIINYTPDWNRVNQVPLASGLLIYLPMEGKSLRWA